MLRLTAKASLSCFLLNCPFSAGAGRPSATMHKHTLTTVNLNYMTKKTFKSYLQRTSQVNLSKDHILCHYEPVHVWKQMREIVIWQRRHTMKMMTKLSPWQLCALVFLWLVLYPPLRVSTCIFIPNVHCSTVGPWQTQLKPSVCATDLCKIDIIATVTKILDKSVWWRRNKSV